MIKHLSLTFIAVSTTLCANANANAVQPDLSGVYDFYYQESCEAEGQEQELLGSMELSSNIDGNSRVATLSYRDGSEATTGYWSDTGGTLLAHFDVLNPSGAIITISASTAGSTTLTGSFRILRSIYSTPDWENGCAYFIKQPD